MREDQSAVFEIERDIDGDLIGYRNRIAIWLVLRNTKNAYCYSQSNISKGMIARFKVKQKEQIGTL